MKNPDTGEIDYDEMREVAKKEKPKIILAGFSGYSRELDYAMFKSIADEVGAIAMADVAHIAGLIAGGVAKNPFDFGFQIVTTTTHKTLRGPRGGMVMSKGTVSNPMKAPDKTVENLPTLIDRAVFPGLQGGPHINTIAAKAVAFGEALSPKFKTYAAQILKNAKAMEKVFAAAKVRMLGGGTSNHLILADVFGSLGIGGKDAEDVLNTVGSTLNKNAIADDTRKPFDPSGIRFGTPAITTRGFKEKECERVAELMLDALNNRSDKAKLDAIHQEIKQLCAKFPIPESFL
jgi:glycine hydroxymethyltransferase